MARPRPPGSLEPRFCRPVTPRVAHRLPPTLEACLEAALFEVRASHQSIHEASRILGEALEHQLDLRRAARAELRATIAAASQALEMLRD